MRPVTAPVLNETAYRQIIHDWNDTLVEFPNLCAHELFEQQAARTPDAIAVIAGGETLSYGELNARANQVAHYLQRCCFGPEALIGVSLHRSLAMVIALLGVWKAGAAYVPLDPSYPPERLAFMVRDAELRLLLTDSTALPNFVSTEVEAVCLDADWPMIAQEKTTNPAATAQPGNLAYVMYTSGSTGQPKGAMIEHGGLLNYLCWAINAYKLQAGASVPVHSSISFDLTVTSLYPALLVGGQVELIAEDEGAQNLLAALRASHNRALVKITPAHLELLSRQLSAKEVAGMCHLFVIGGENLPAESLRLWRQNAPETRLINEYGPTETVVGCCVYEVRPNDPESGPVAIGHPIANTRLYVLDPAQQPVPPGVVGELYIGGVGVARGYLNRPDLTSERFLPDPFVDDPLARVFRTGDLARYRADGTLEYLGRGDRQVKVGGYRIELGEIEASLASHPAVQSCTVIVREDEPGNRQLVAYVVADPGALPDAAELHAFLKRHLPAHMVPAQFVRLDSFPLNINGKIDRTALPAPAYADLVPVGQFAAAHSGIEHGLSEIWRKLLKLDQIGINDDVFELGVRSLQAAKAVVEMRAAFAVDLQLRHIFEQPTVAGLAEVIEKLRWLARTAEPAAVVAEREEIEL